MSHILDSLNASQKEAVEAVSGPVLIMAGPGSGKTRVIIHRIAYLVNVCGVSPRNILAVTFTNKAAREMRERLEHMVPSASQDITMGTFHAICAKILRIEGKHIGIMPEFVIYDQGDQLALVKRCLAELNIDSKQFAPQAILGQISFAKSCSFSPADYIKHGRSYFEEVAGRAYERYQSMLVSSCALDFDDLLMRVVELFHSHKEILKKYQSRYVHVMVDEFQDTNLVQYTLVRMLSGGYSNLCVVGDPDQSIYSWRSADLRNILNFEKDHPGAKTIVLSQNYRSTKNIIDAAFAVISMSAQRKEKELFTENEQGELVTLTEAFDEKEEAQYVANEVVKLTERGDVRAGDIAVMYRTNAQSRSLEEAFMRYGIPYKLVGGMRFYERREVKDIIAYLRIILNPSDDISFLRVINVPLRGIGERTVSELSALASEQGLSLSGAIDLLAKQEGVSGGRFSARAIKLFVDFTSMMNKLREKQNEISLLSLFDMLVSNIRYREYLKASPDGDERWENINELRGVASDYNCLAPGEALAAFLEGVTLVSDVDGLIETADSVTLITLHQAKGLEFDTVFMTGLEDGVLPHMRSFDDPAQMEEERRLFYVGITRAKKRLYLVRAFRRFTMGASCSGTPSRFLKDIPARLTRGARPWKVTESQLKLNEHIDEWNINQEPMKSVVEIGFKAGDTVRHNIFGQGIVVSANRARDDVSLIIAFKGDVGVKKLSQNYAQLEKVE